MISATLFSVVWLVRQRGNIEAEVASTVRHWHNPTIRSQNTKR